MRDYSMCDACMCDREFMNRERERKKEREREREKEREREREREKKREREKERKRERFGVCDFRPPIPLYGMEEQDFACCGVQKHVSHRTSI